MPASAQGQPLRRHPAFRAFGHAACARDRAFPPTSSSPAHPWWRVARGTAAGGNVVLRVVVRIVGAVVILAVDVVVHLHAVEHRAEMGQPVCSNCRLTSISSCRRTALKLTTISEPSQFLAISAASISAPSGGRPPTRSPPFASGDPAACRTAGSQQRQRIGDLAPMGTKYAPGMLVSYSTSSMFALPASRWERPRVSPENCRPYLDTITERRRSASTSTTFLPSRAIVRMMFIVTKDLPSEA